VEVLEMLRNKHAIPYSSELAKREVAELRVAARFRVEGRLEIV
jgi:hypothetical protein